MKNKFKYELHLHTKEIGWCARVWAKDAVDTYYNEGYDGICITNHFFKEGMESLEGDSWFEKVDSYLQGYINAKEYSQKYKNFDVILGIELKLNEGPQDYLIYGMNKELLYKMEDIFSYNVKQCFEFANKNNLLLIQAHPLRPYLKMQELEYLHGLETFNGNTRHDNNNEKVYEIASENSKIMIAGSDFHELGDEAVCGMIFPDRIKNSKALTKALKKGQSKIFIREKFNF